MQLYTVAIISSLLHFWTASNVVAQKEMFLDLRIGIVLVALIGSARVVLGSRG